VAALLAAALVAPPAEGQSSNPKEKPSPEKGATEETRVPTPSFDRQKLASHFNASSAEWTSDGRLRLVYDFSTKELELLDDWAPKIAETKRRIRWSQGYEGTWTTVEDGLIIADQGTFVHQAVWDGDVELSVDYLSMSASAKNDVLAAVYIWNRGRSVVGSQLGDQCIRLSRSLAPRGRPIPARTLTPIAVEDRLTFGVRMDHGVVSALRNGRVRASSEGDPKFVKKPGPGQVGLAWKGRVNGFVFKIVIEGRLDPDWVEKHIPGGLLPPTDTAGR